MTQKIEGFTPGPCPWCGSTPEVQPWHGGAPTKHLVGCSDDGCLTSPAVTGETLAEAVANWNDRHDTAENERLRARVQTLEAEVDGYHKALREQLQR